MGSQGLLKNFENRKFNCHRQSSHHLSVASTPVAAPFELYAVPHVGLFLDCLGYAARMKFFSSIVRFVCHPQCAFCTECYVFLTGSGTAALTERLDVMVRNKESFMVGRETFCER